jgi:hypothetical protein
MYRQFSICLLLMVVISHALAQTTFTKSSTPWPEIPDPPRAKVEWVGDDMRVNGLPMRIQKFESEASKEEVVAYYAAYWKAIVLAPMAKPTEVTAAITTNGMDTLITRMHGPFYNMVKVRDSGSGRSEGTISTSQVLGVEPKIDPSGIPAPQSAQAVSVIEGIDLGKRNKQVLYVTKDNYSSVLQYYQSNLNASGWKLLQEQISKPEHTSGRATVRMYTKELQQLDIAIGFDAVKQVTVINANLVSFINS